MVDAKPPSAPPAADPVMAGLKGRCPRCGKGRLFSGFLKLAPACPRCRLDYAFIDSGDGPTAFVILLVGFVVLGGALWLELTLAPPVWVHFVLWLPLTVLLSLPLLRMMKGVLVAMQYRHKAAEGRLETRR
jgi:uncharacterized protein (DUF983 family)